jgi:hypothetical protein
MNYNSSTCIICFNSHRGPTKLFCGHTFCNECIVNWSSQSDKCPICRQSFNLEVTHNYSTRQNYHIQNKEIIMNKMRDFLDHFTWLCLEYEEKVKKFDEILTYIYENKELLKNKKFKNVVLNKIDYLKKEDEFIGYYWSQKIY